MRLFALAGALLLSACSNPLVAHSHVAETLEDIAAQGRPIILEQRLGELREAAAEAQAADADVTAAVNAAAVEFDDGPILGAYNAYVAAKQAYILGVLARSRDGRPDFADMLPIAREVLAAYEGLKEALGERGARLPALPPFLTTFINGDDR